MTTFYKLSGAGNDFIALVDVQDPAGASIRAWSRRGLSLGADGVITVACDGGRVRMSYWNCDGARSRLCLNGTRCAAQLAFFLGWAEADLILDTDAGTLSAHRLGEDNVALILPPLATRPERRALTVDGVDHHGWYLGVGVPHFVVEVDGCLGDAPVAALGPRLRQHPDLGPAGANIDFVRTLDRQRLELRTWERGVEAETLACGTGVIAAVAAGVSAGTLDLPVTARVASGYTLQVAGTVDDGLLATVSLAGDARVVARGELLAGSVVVPASLDWQD